MSDRLLDQSGKAREAFFAEHAQLLQRLGREQMPQALFVGCSDSRVTPETLFGLSPGQWFMLRNVGNIVPPYWQTEIGIASVLEFAVLHLEVPHIIICGHTDCGGMHGLVQGVDLDKTPALARWLEIARPALYEADERSGVDRHTALVERNVVLQLRHLESYPYIRARLDSGAIQLHGWVYDLQQRAVRSYSVTQNRFTSAA